MIDPQELTDMKIAGNPYDLCLKITKSKTPGANGSWSIYVSRGSGNNFEPIVTALEPEQLRRTKKVALGTVKSLLWRAVLATLMPCELTRLQSVLRSATEDKGGGKELTFREFMATATVKHGCLTLDVADRIIAELGEKGECDTFTFSEAA